MSAASRARHVAGVVARLLLSALRMCWKPVYVVLLVTFAAFGALLMPLPMPPRPKPPISVVDRDDDDKEP